DTLAGGGFGDGVVLHRGILGEPAGVPAWARAGLSGRVPDSGAAVPRAVRAAGTDSRAPPPARDVVAAGAESVPPPLLGPVLRRGGLDRRRGVGGVARRAGRRAAACRAHGGMGGVVGDVSVDRPRRPGLVRLRLG